MAKEKEYEVYYYLIDRVSSTPMARYKTLEDLEKALLNIEQWRMDFYREEVADNKCALSFALKALTNLDVYKMSYDGKDMYASGQFNHILGFYNLDFSVNAFTREEKKQVRDIFKKFELELVETFYKPARRLNEYTPF